MSFRHMNIHVKLIVHADKLYCQIQEDPEPQQRTRWTSESLVRRM